MSSHDNYNEKYLKYLKYKMKYNKLKSKLLGGAPYMSSLKEKSFTQSLLSVGIDGDEFVRTFFNYDLFIRRLCKLSELSKVPIESLITKEDLLEYLNNKSQVNSDLNIFLSDNLKDLNLLVTFDIFGLNIMNKINRILVWNKQISLSLQIEIIDKLIKQGTSSNSIDVIFHRHIDNILD